MVSLITSDIHLDLKPINEHRWSLLPWLKKKGKELKIDLVLILGDATVEKDKHSSILVNRFVDQLVDLSEICDIILLKGNHDYLSESNPFFQFCQFIGDGRIEYIAEPSTLYLPLGGTAKTPCLFLPTTSHPTNEWKELDFNKHAYIFTHQTFDGAKAENGQTLTGISPTIFSEFTGKILSGDIHTPQTVSKKPSIRYVGAPYRTSFGDTYIPRILFIDKDGQENNLKFPTIQKHLVVIRSIDELDEYGKEVRSNDQVKIRMQLLRSEYPQWPSIKQQILDYSQTKQWIVCGLEPTAIATNLEKQESEPSKTIDPIALMTTYARNHKADDELTKIGLEILQESIKR